MSKFIRKLQPKFSSKIAVRRRGLERAKKLKKFADSALCPEETWALNCAYDRMCKIYGWGNEQKVEVLTILLRNGCSRYDELAEESGINYEKVFTLIQTMAERNIVTLAKSVRFGTGRRATEIRLNLPEK